MRCSPIQIIGGGGRTPPLLPAPMSMGSCVNCKCTLLNERYCILTGLSPFLTASFILFHYFLFTHAVHARTRGVSGQDAVSHVFPTVFFTNLSSPAAVSSSRGLKKLISSDKLWIINDTGVHQHQYHDWMDLTELSIDPSRRTVLGNEC